METCSHTILPRRSQVTTASCQNRMFRRPQNSRACPLPPPSPHRHILRPQLAQVAPQQRDAYQGGLLMGGQAAGAGGTQLSGDDKDGLERAHREVVVLHLAG